jgi:hypothetical protein
VTIWHATVMPVLFTAASAPDSSVPWWALAVAIAFSGLLALAGIGTDWRRWRTQDAVASWRLGGLRNVATRVCGVTVVVSVLVLAPSSDSAAAHMISVALLGSVTLIALVQAAALRSRRSERLMDEAWLRERRLPVRKQRLSCGVVAALAYGGGWLALVVLGLVLSLPLTLIEDDAVRLDASVLLAFVLSLVWLAAATWITLRQWRRLRREDAEYWPRFRKALLARAGGDAGAEG